jgi:non-specific serine/threonine protein kinase
LRGNVAIARAEVARYSLGDERLAEQELTRARSLLTDSAELARAQGDAWGAAKAAHWLMTVAGLRGDSYDTVIALGEQSLAAFRRLGDLRQVCNVLWNLGAALAARDAHRGRVTLAESLTLAAQLGYRWHSGLCLVALAAVAADLGEPLRPSVHAWHDRVAERVRGDLGADGFAAAWSAGAALTPEAVIAEALTRAAPAQANEPELDDPAAQHRLTAREHEVLHLLVEGKSDREIAAALFVSRRTAASHVASILRKLGVPSRAAAAAYAVRHGLA